ncbi:MAG TPA: vitamin B12-dependent ribonucleotide reductase [Pirellulales bacterium]|nr:vitamin B12-dependent ribonucleotide reductase [Pirellulales bacterium]
MGNSKRNAGRLRAGGLAIDSLFCPASAVDPFETVEWDLRTAAIKGEGGEVLFEQKNCEVPKFWSQLSTNVVVSKYFYGENGTPERESSVRQLIHRVSRTIADWGLADGYFASAADGEQFYRELTWLCLHQHGAFNSPVWFNVGLFHQYGVKGAQCNWHWDAESSDVKQPENPYEYPQGSACFIQSVNDNMEDIMELARSEAMLFKFGSGTGTDLSTLRSHREKLSGGGRPSGPLSFMRVYDQIAAVVKSGGKTRRAAKMQSLKVEHPDVMEFIECKAKEENKARVLIEKGGYESNFNGEAYSSILFQNANLSVRVSDAFMQAVEKDQPWTTRWVTDAKREGPTLQAREIMQRMAECAWQCGDPGVQYDTTINRWNTCPESGRINASNPCSEYMFLDDTACNLASINLMKFRREDGTFDVERFQVACRIFFIAQEILVDHASYPTKKIAANSHCFRPLGLGYSNLGSLLMAGGVPYDSDAARGLCGAITALLHGTANLTSVELAAAVGPFEAFEQNREPMLEVMQMHRDAVEQINSACPGYLKDAAQGLWDQVLDEGHRFGFRNAQATVLAPTGTISFLMDCDTTGIEPDIALVKYKQLAGGGMLKIVNNTVPSALKTLGYDQPKIESILAYIEKNDMIEGANDLQPEHLAVFDCAFKPMRGQRSIAWHAHVTTMAAAQPFLSGAISKTVNMPRETTPADIANAYMEGWRLGLKALAIYRDGSKESQPLNTGTESDKAAAKVVAAPRRERLPDTRDSVTHKFSIVGHEGYLTVGLYDRVDKNNLNEIRRPGELFINMAKEGSTIGGLMDAFGTAVSMSLQYGVPLEVLVNKFSHMRFEPMGQTKNPEVRIAKSVVDYIFRWMGNEFLRGYKEAASKGLHNDEPAPLTNAVDLPGPAVKNQGSAVKGQESAQKPASGARAPEAASAGNQTSTTKPIVTKQVTNGAHNGSNGHGKAASIVADNAALLHRSGAVMHIDQNAGAMAREEQFASFQLDAPSCDNCGNITVRNGNCYLCHNCGNSMGCS